MIAQHEARVNITWRGQNGDLPDPVRFDAGPGDVRQWVSEAIRGGGIPGLPVDANVNLHDHVVERFAANATRPYHLILVRPKTAFGG